MAPKGALGLGDFFLIRYERRPHDGVPLLLVLGLEALQPGLPTMDIRKLGIATVVLCGCVIAPDPRPLASATIASDFQTYSIRRVGLLRLHDDDLHRALDRAVRIEFLEASDYVIAPTYVGALSSQAPSERRSGWTLSLEALPPEALEGLDALLIPEVIDINTSDPQRLELRLDLVACETGLTIWSATAWVDSTDRDVWRRIQEWQAQLPGGVLDGDPELVLHSPERLVRFAVRQLAGLL